MVGDDFMKKHVLRIICVLTLCTMVFAGCSKPTSKDGNNQLNQEITALKEKNTKLENEKKALEEQLGMCQGRLNKQLDILEQLAKSGKKSGFDIIPIYTANIDTYKREVDVYTLLPRDKTLEEKLDYVADTLSKQHFSGLPIEIVKIEDVDGKSVAIVNLEELPENQGITDTSKYKGESWAIGHFQGSSGGTTTSTTLIETFLQKEYKGEWVDGVKFLYNDKEIGFDHVEEMNGGNISYRE